MKWLPHIKWLVLLSGILATCDIPNTPSPAAPGTISPTTNPTQPALASLEGLWVATSIQIKCYNSSLQMVSTTTIAPNDSGTLGREPYRYMRFTANTCSTFIYAAGDTDYAVLASAYINDDNSI